MKNLEKQSIRDLIFDPRLYTEYPYYWQIQNEDGTTSIIFSKKPRYTLVEELEILNKMKKINLIDKSHKYLFKSEVE